MVVPVAAVSLAFFWIVLQALSNSSVVTPLFSWTPLRYLGNMSYSYYLIHGATMKGVAKVLHNRQTSPWLVGVELVVSFACTWVTATLLFLLVEKRFSLQPWPRKGMSHAAHAGAASGPMLTYDGPIDHAAIPARPGGR